MTFKSGILLAIATIFAACSAKVAPNEGAVSLADPRDLPKRTEPLTGTVEGQAWRLGKGVALYQNGEYSVTLAGAGVPLTCQNFFPLAPHISFVVPNGTGSYTYDGSAGGRLVNVIFPYSTPNGGGSNNVLASKSQIDVIQITAGQLHGRVAALSPVGASHAYELGGSFAAEICNGPGGPLEVKIKGAQAFAVAYSEAVKLADGVGGHFYEIRLMNKIPRQKCNTWDAWMMTEVPIKYVSIRAPNKVGAYSITRGWLEYGSQGQSSGWSTDYFQGSAQVIALDAGEMEYSIDAKDTAAMDISVLGQNKTVLCK